MKLNKRLQRELKIYAVLACVLVGVWGVSLSLVKILRIERDQLSEALRDLQIPQLEDPIEQSKDAQLKEVQQKAQQATKAKLDPERMKINFEQFAEENSLKVKAFQIEERPKSQVKGEWPFAVTLLHAQLEGELDQDIYRFTQHLREINGVPVYLTSLIIKRVSPDTTGVVAKLTYELWHATY